MGKIGAGEGAQAYGHGLYFNSQKPQHGNRIIDAQILELAQARGRADAPHR